jgi:uridine kinase
LLNGKSAGWNAFDFASGTSPDGTYKMCSDFVERGPASVVILDGTYSARPELADLIDLSVLLDVRVAIRHQRLSEREGKKFLDAWHARWDGAEEHYFTYVRPPSSFDLVVKNDAPAGYWAAE